MLDYSTKKIDNYLHNIKETVNTTPDFASIKINESLEKFKGTKDYIRKYDELLRKYAYCGRNYLIAKNDIEKFKGYYNLAAKAGGICIKLAEKGYDTYQSSILDNLKTRRNVFHYVKYAVLSNDMDLAIDIAFEESLLGAILLGDYEKAKKYLPKDIKDIPNTCDTEQMLWTIAYFDERKMNQHLEKVIKSFRRQAKTFPAVCFDDWGLAIIKLAKQRGMTCNLNVVELPYHLLDNEPIDKEKWKLPEDRELEKMLL